MMQPHFPPQDPGLIQKLASALETALSSIKESRQQIDASKNQIQQTSDELDKLKDETGLKLISLHNEFPLLRENVTSLSKLIKEGGNGNDSLLTRLRLMESQDRELNERLDRLAREVNGRIDAQNIKIESHFMSHSATANTQNERNWQVKLAIGVAGLALASTIITPVLTRVFIAPAPSVSNSGQSPTPTPSPSSNN